MWWTGTNTTKDAMFETWAGKAWIAVLCAVLGTGAVIVLGRSVLKAYGERSELPGRVKKAAFFWVIGVFAVVAFPVNEFRHRRLEGSGIVGTVLGPAGMLIVGAAVSLATVGFSMLGVSAILLTLGVVE